MRTQQPGELTWPIIRDKVDEILLVSDAQVVEALKLLLFRLKILVEPTGAVAPAAVLQRMVGPAGSKVGVIISGGNLDTALLAQLLNSYAEGQN
jgi:threonine dehydratase